MNNASLFSWGINHQSAPLALRERFALNAEQIPNALQTLTQQPAVNEAVILSTCNRTEIYSCTDNPDNIVRWLTNQYHDIDINLQQHSYQHRDEQVARHLMRVASGLDSMVLGEPQILGQVKQAYQLADQHGTVGHTLGQLFPAAFSASKQVRSQTDIGKNPVTMAYAIVQLINRIFSDLKNVRILCIGAGDMISLITTHLYHLGVHDLTIANRTIEKAADVARHITAKAIRIGDIPRHLTHCDVIITATASQLPILGKGLLESTLKQNRRPLLLVDLAIPRDIEAEVAELEDAYLYNVDDLQSIIDANLKNRAQAAKQAEAIIELQVEQYLRELRIAACSDMIRHYRDKLHGLCDQELQKALAHLHNGQNPELVLQHFAHNLVNKMIHQPTLRLRAAADSQGTELLTLAKELFDL